MIESRLPDTEHVDQELYNLLFMAFGYASLRMSESPTIPTTFIGLAETRMVTYAAKEEIRTEEDKANFVARCRKLALAHGILTCCIVEPTTSRAEDPEPGLPSVLAVAENMNGHRCEMMSVHAIIEGRSQGYSNAPFWARVTRPAVYVNILPRERDLLMQAEALKYLVENGIWFDGENPNESSN